MKFYYQLLPLALKDFRQASEWYLSNSFSAADRFTAAIELALDHICADPYRYINTYENYREYFVQKFPYTIIYKIEKDIVLIVAIYHQKRNPRKKYR